MLSERVLWVTGAWWALAWAGWGFRFLIPVWAGWAEARFPPRLLKAKGGLFPGIQLLDAARGDGSLLQGSWAPTALPWTFGGLGVRGRLGRVFCTRLLAALPPREASGLSDQECTKDARSSWILAGRTTAGWSRSPPARGGPQAGPLPACSVRTLHGLEDAGLHWRSCDLR